MKENKRSEPVTTLLQTLEEQIRRRACEPYEARGRGDGHELDDWLEAEANITHTQQKATAA